MGKKKLSLEDGFIAFATDFLLGGVAAAISKTCASPIEVIKMRI